MRTFPLVLADTYMLTPSVKHFIFTVDQPTPFVYQPGQFITIQLEHEGKILKRSYSIANPPNTQQRIEFSASFVAGGIASAFLFHLVPGASVLASGPFGRLILKDPPPARYILAATGTGITPYHAMLDKLAMQIQHNPDLKVIIIQGVRRHDDLLFAESFQRAARQSSNIIFKPVFSREDSATLTTEASRGYIQDVLDTLNLNPEKDTVYLCGNPNMIDACFEKLKNLSFPIQQIVREKYI